MVCIYAGTCLHACVYLWLRTHAPKEPRLRSCILAYSAQKVYASFSRVTQQPGPPNNLCRFRQSRCRTPVRAAGCREAARLRQIWAHPRPLCQSTPGLPLRFICLYLNNTYIYTHVRVYVFHAKIEYVNMYIHMFMYMYIYICTYTYTYIYIDVYIDTYV